MEKYSILVQWSDDDEGFIAIIPELPGLSAFGETPEEATQELLIAQKLYIKVHKEDGCKLPKPEKLKYYSGQTRLRLPKSLHESLAVEAKKEGVSLNSYIINLLSQRNQANTVDKKLDRIQQFIIDSSLLTDLSTTRPESANPIYNMSDTPVVSIVSNIVENN